MHNVIELNNKIVQLKNTILAKEAAVKELKAMVRERDWQPAHTIPYDKGAILVKTTDGDVYKVAWLNNNEGGSLYSNEKIMVWAVPESWQDEQGGYFSVHEDEIAGWMPLPK